MPALVAGMPVWPVLCDVQGALEWSGRAPAPPASDARTGKCQTEHRHVQQINSDLATMGIDIGKNSFHVGPAAQRKSSRLPIWVANHYGLKVLPVRFVRPWPVAIITLKNRTSSPVVKRFIECAGDVTKLRMLNRPAPD